MISSLKWLKPGASARPRRGGRNRHTNPDQRIHEDARRLSDLSGDLGIGLLQASLLLLSFIGSPMEHLGRTRHLDLRDQSEDPGLHGVVRASSMLRAVRGSLGVLAAPSWA